MQTRPVVRLLGPVEVHGPDGVAALVGTRQRALVAVLALSPRSVVSHARLVDALWGEDPPRTAVRTLQSHVARVRAAVEVCGLPGILRTRDPGYVLDLADDGVDVRRAGALTRSGAPKDLEAALELWRGDALVDVGEGDWVTAERERLGELRLTIVERLWEARLGSGTADTPVDELERCVAAAPTRERLVGLLMRVLYRHGRHTDALSRFDRLRRLLADDLGLDPSPDLVALHTAILRHDPGLDAAAAPAIVPVTGPTAGSAAGTVAGSAAGSAGRSGAGRAAPEEATPHELPPLGGHLSGRLTELDRLRRAQDAIRIVTGQGGIGKTALAVHWAHAARERYPDGQVFLDLRGHDPDLALPPEDALAQVLRSLGTPPEQIAPTAAQMTAQYRSLLDGRRVLILLDNAGTADHVLPLVPPNPSSTLVVTSRRRLAALAVHHETCLVELDVLGGAQAGELLARALGADRVAAEPQATGALADICEGLPLALRIAAARLAASPRRLIADLVEELAEEVLEGLAIDGDDRSVRSVYASAFNALSEPAAALFARLGRHPGPTFSAHLAAAVGRTTVGRVRRSLDELASAHLITETGSGRFRFHDLIRRFAGQCPDDAGDAEAAIIDWHVSVAAVANRLLGPVRTRLIPTPVAAAPAIADAAAASALLDDERANHLPVVARAARVRPELACTLVYLLGSYYSRRSHVVERLALCGAGVAAAEAVDDRRELEGVMRSGRAIALIAARRYDEALGELGEALVAVRSGGHVEDESGVHNNRAVALGALGRYAEAAQSFERALALVAGTDPVVEAETLNNLGFARTLSGGDGVAPLLRALELATVAGHRSLRAEVLDGLGHAYRARGDADRAVAYLHDAVREFRDLDDHARVPDVLATAGAVLLDAGDSVRARADLIEALALSRTADDEHVEQQVLADLARADHLAAATLR